MKDAAPPQAQPPPPTPKPAAPTGVAVNGNNKRPEPLAPSGTLEGASNQAYTWEEAKKLCGEQLEKIYGAFPGALPWVVRDALGDALCPLKDSSRDFYLDNDTYTLENCKLQFEDVASRLPKGSPHAKVVAAWLAGAKKSGFVPAFKQASDAMTKEIKIVLEAKNPSANKPQPPSRLPLGSSAMSLIPKEAPAPAASPSSKPAASLKPAASAIPAAASAAQPLSEVSVQSLSDLRRKMYRKSDDTASLSPSFAVSSIIASRNAGGIVEVETRARGTGGGGLFGARGLFSGN